MSGSEPGAPETSQRRRAYATLRSQVQPGSFPLLLAAIGVLYTLIALEITSFLSDVARAAVLLACVYVLSAHRALKWLAAVLAVFVFIADHLSRSVDPGALLAIQDSSVMIFLVWVLVAVLREVFRPSTAERDAVIGALCGFLLILFAFARMHGLLEALHPGSYGMQASAPATHGSARVIATFQYFSTITMTTVGYGDIVPLTPAARFTTGAEAILGQLYIAVVIAALVGRAASRRT